MNTFNRPDAIISVTLSDRIVLDTLKRCLAYGGHDAYVASSPIGRGREVEHRIVLFTTMAGFEQFKLAFEDLFVSMDFTPEAFEQRDAVELAEYREALTNDAMVL